jgi:ankyrin repeat protein
LALIKACPAEIRDQLVLYRPRISGITALHRCASAVQPSCESARVLLSASSDGGSSLLTAQNLNGETALHLAAQRANKEFLLTLLRAVDKPMPVVKEVKGDYLSICILE